MAKLFARSCAVSAWCVMTTDAGPLSEMLERRWNSSAARALRGAVAERRIVWLEVCARASTGMVMMLVHVRWFASPARGFQRASAPVFIALGMLAVACLDTYPIGGGVTSLELLSAGAPIVTYGGGMSVYELLPGFYEAMGFTSLIASSPLEFVQLALRLHRDAAWRATTVRSIMKLSYARQCWRLRARGTR